VAQLIRWILPRAILVTTLALAGCGTSGPAYRPASPDAAATVEMTSTFSFQPETVRIKTGEVVEWRNKSLFAHTVTDDPQKEPGVTVLPTGATPFDSGRIPPGEVFRHSFSIPGTYRYTCVPHEELGMTGVIIVEPQR
jgi:plastocyanin